MLPAFRRGLQFFDATLLCVHLSFVDAIGRLLLGQGSGRAWHAPDGVLVGLQRDAEVLGLLYTAYDVTPAVQGMPQRYRGLTRSSFEPSMLSQRNAWKCAAALRTMMIRPSPNPTHMRSPCTLLCVSAAQGVATARCRTSSLCCTLTRTVPNGMNLYDSGLSDRGSSAFMKYLPRTTDPFTPIDQRPFINGAVRLCIARTTRQGLRSPDCNAETV